MNLIEKLGGYDKAKGIRDINIQEFDGDASGVMIHYMGNLFLQEDLELALLEHRRENNIFEMGDLVVLTSTGTKGVLLEIIDHKYTNDLHRVKIVKLGSCGPIHKDQIRHATPKEIKAGHRL